MTDPPVDIGYAPLPQQISGKRTAAWISLLVLGVLTICAGMCLGGGVGLVGVIFTVRAGPGGAPSPPMPLGLLAAVVAMLLIPVTAGIIEIACAVKLKKGSRPAGITAATVIALQLVAVIGLMTLSVLLNMTGKPNMTDLLMGLAFYGAIALFLALVEWLVLRAVNEIRPPTLTRSNFPLNV